MSAPKIKEAFLQTEKTMLKAARDAGRYAAQSHEATKLFVIWRDMAKVLQVTKGQMYASAYSKARAQFIFGFKDVFPGIVIPS